ncbi:MAG TPA: dihydrodipicolinate synthase family protein [Gemmatimonadaceae bacterium]|nr:dihydrodipicolinate synthase family protein [Gemmatimonadaceae bacterium]
MTRLLSGILGPVTTPFDSETGDLAPVSFRSLLAAHLSAGLDGIVVAGSTGEAALLEEAERRQLVELARAVVPADKWLIVGVGGESTRLTIRRAADASARGADAVLVVSPHYYGAAMTREALAGHFLRVADGCSVPVVLYNIPKYAHLTLEPSLVAELARHEQVIGIKDSSGDLVLLRAYLQSQSAAFSVLTGSGISLHAALEMGARGGVLAVALFASALTLEVYDAFQFGNRNRAMTAQERLVPLAREIVAGFGVAGVKAALDSVGLAGGRVRSPLLPLRWAQRAEIRELLRAAELAPANMT